jgi:hypothetical protein
MATGTATQSPWLQVGDSHDLIRVHGARENNLKDVSVELRSARRQRRGCVAPHEAVRLGPVVRTAGKTSHRKSRENERGALHDSTCWIEFLASARALSDRSAPATKIAVAR